MQKQPTSKKFELIYSNGDMISGTTVGHFKSAPTEGIQFLIVLYSDGSVTKFKALDEYEYMGATKKGSLTSDDNFAELKARVHEISHMMVNYPLDRRGNKI